MSRRRNNLILRSRVLQSVRDFFSSKGFLEVETPLRIPANAPEEHIEPCRSGDMYLQTSPEMCMKRLLCRGYDKIFQISRCWRSGERGSRHLSEFTMLEWYRSGSDYLQLMQDCGDLLRWVASSCDREEGVTFQGVEVDLLRAPERITMREAFHRFSHCSMTEAVQSGNFDELIVTQIEPQLQLKHPVILMDYPAEMAALARIKTHDTQVAERFELYAGGLELANGFSELNDPVEQRQRFVAANERRAAAGCSPLPLPEPFLQELATMPPSAGIALGLDRLVMLLADAATIDEVVAFTTEEL